VSKPADYLPSRAARHADPQQLLQTAQMTVQQSRYRTALVRDQIGRLELEGETRAAQLLRKWYLDEGGGK
jgi:hypothetical protein